jgi:hypothetical protein
MILKARRIWLEKKFNKENLEKITSAIEAEEEPEFDLEDENALVDISTKGVQKTLLFEEIKSIEEVPLDYLQLFAQKGYNNVCQVIEKTGENYTIDKSFHETEELWMSYLKQANLGLKGGY